MKLLDTPKFDPFIGAIRQSGDYKLDFRLENYSCKMISTDKRLFKKFSASRLNGQPQLLSPPQSDASGCPQQMAQACVSFSDDETSGGGFLAPTISHKTLFYLISTLNSSFFDYDFSECCSEEFSREALLDRVQADVDDRLGRCVPNFASFRPAFWQTLEDEISLSDCDIYSYNPDNVCDPYYADVLWSFNYMFFNKKLKRIVFLSCCARSALDFVSDSRGRGESGEEFDRGDEASDY